MVGTIRNKKEPIELPSLSLLTDLLSYDWKPVGDLSKELPGMRPKILLPFIRRAEALGVIRTSFFEKHWHLKLRNKYYDSI